MIDIENPKRIKRFGKIEHAKIICDKRTVYISLPEHIKRSGYCVVYKMSGQVETRQELTKGTNIIKHVLSNGKYLMTLSIGSKMIIEKIEIE